MVRLIHGMLRHREVDTGLSRNLRIFYTRPIKAFPQTDSFTAKNHGPRWFQGEWSLGGATRCIVLVVQCNLNRGYCTRLAHHRLKKSIGLASQIDCCLRHPVLGSLLRRLLPRSGSLCDWLRSSPCVGTWMSLRCGRISFLAAFTLSLAL